MNRLTRFFFIILYLLFGNSVYASIDTNTINKWNTKALDLAYTDPKQAMILAIKSEKASKKIGFSRGEVRALLRIGIIYDVTNKNTEAINAYTKSLQLSFQTHDDKGIASNLNNLGLINYKLNHFFSALKYFHRAYIIFKKINDQYNLGSVANNIGMIHEEQKQDASALKWFRKSLNHYNNAKETVTIYDVYTNIGNLYLKKNYVDSSIYYSNLALDGYLKNKNLYGAGIVSNNLGNAYESQKAKLKAKSCFENAINYSNQVGNTYSKVSSSYGLASFYFDQGEYQRAENILNSLLTQLDEANSNELNFKIYYDLAKIETINRNSKQSLKYLKLYTKYYDLYLNETMNKNMIELADKFELKEIKQRNVYRLKQFEDKRVRENLIWTGGVLLMLLLFILFIFIRRKSVLQLQLENQKAIFEATIEERKRISYDLHDHVGSQLSYVVNNLELLHHINSSDERISNSYAMGVAAMTSLRDTVWTLHSEELSTSALVQRIENVMHKTLELNPEIATNLDVNITEEFLLSPQQCMQIIRIFQEALHNISKHSKATKVEIGITQLNETITLTIVDNGIGLVEGDKKPFHYGLQSMNERAIKMNGILEILSETNKGTTVQLKWMNTSIA